MFSFLKKMFSKQKEMTPEEQLINTLKNDHKNLINIYMSIDKAVKNNEFIETKEKLKKFVSEYNRHILLEDTQLYISLEDKYKDKKQVLKTIQSIGKDMNSITRAITFFEKKYQTINHDNKDIFIEEFKHIGQVLTERVGLEEERLYPLL